MHLIVGLGNPGAKYLNNRHNAGFQATDVIAETYNLKYTHDKFSSQVYSGKVSDYSVSIIKPLLFMNNSGKAVSQYSSFYKILPQNIFIIYDDLDMKLGKVRIKCGGSDGGHNGIKSINSFVKNEYFKVKIGVGHPGHKDYVSNYVLQDFEKSEKDLLAVVYLKMAKHLPLLLQGEVEQFAGIINNENIE